MMDSNELRDRAIQGRKAWSVLYRRMDAFLFTIFSAKIKQEDHAEHGREPDLENGECPVMLCDYRHEVKFTYTVTKRSYTQVNGRRESSSSCPRGEEKGFGRRSPRELTKEDIDGIKHHQCRRKMPSKRLPTSKQL